MSAKRVLEMLSGAEGKKVTREEYIAFNWAGIDIPEWTPEHEAELPEELQDMSLFEQRGYQLVYIGPPIPT